MFNRRQILTALATVPLLPIVARLPRRKETVAEELARMEHTAGNAPAAPSNARRPHIHWLGLPTLWDAMPGTVAVCCFDNSRNQKMKRVFNDRVRNAIDSHGVTRFDVGRYGDATVVLLSRSEFMPIAHRFKQSA